VDFPTQREGLALAGTGVRLKFGVVPVYAVRLYAKERKGVTLADLETERTDIRITLVRTVDRSTFVSAIEDSVAKRCDDQVQVKAFADLFLAHPNAKLVPKTTTIITLEPDGRVALTVDGILLGFVKAPQVKTALLDVYLGPASVSPSVRDDVLDTDKRLFSSSKSSGTSPSS